MFARPSSPPVPTSHTYIRCQQSISLPKLASLAELDEAALRAQLDLLRASTQVITWNGGDALAGAPTPAGDLDFSLETTPSGETMVVVREARSVGTGGSAFLISHIQKLQDITAELEGIALPQQPAAAVNQPTPVAAA
jgi:RNA polymerase I-associated factor PAF67